MKKEIFKVGDKVYHIQYGWGEVEAEVFDNEINQQTYRVYVRFLDGNISFTFDGKEFEEDKQSLLSFTEYTLQGFSQERPIELPEVGELCLVSDNSKDWIVKNFAFIRHNEGYKYFMNNGASYKYMKRIKILD